MSEKVQQAIDKREQAKRRATAPKRAAETRKANTKETDGAQGGS